MASLPAALVSNAPARKSFAQVAAAAHKSIMPKENFVHKTAQTSAVQSSSPLQHGVAIPHDEVDLRPVVNSFDPVVHIASATDQTKDRADDLPGLLQAVHLRDRHALSTEHLPKKESDTKSVASRTTLTLDEKESLLPDDSASMQAAIEEDTFSPTGSIVAGSREGSDPDARAFRDQLHAIDRTSAPGLVPQNGVVVGTLPVTDPRNGGIVFATPHTAAVPFNPADPTRSDQLRNAVTGVVIPPDEKLLEALASPKDRLFVLKVEQDMIDFIRDSKEEFLQLPQTNSFYRMLSHKLADYYLLGHLIDESMTSVRIYRTPHSRLPPPLMGSNSSGDGTTPPPTAVARKIMRRGLEGYGNSRGAGRNINSQGSSKATSDIGQGSGGDEGNDSAKDKSALTREEREARYKETRARIFKDFKEDVTDGADGVVPSTEKEASRSSSTSGVKKGKKHKKPKDDGFEARSVYSQFGNQLYSTIGMTQPVSDGSFLNPFAQYAMNGQTTASHRPLESDRPLVASSFPTYNQQTPVWPSQVHSQGYMMGQTPNPTEFQGHDGYQSSNVFSNPLHSFPSPNTASQATPKMSAQPLAGFNPEYVHENNGVDWSQNNFNDPYGNPGLMYNNGYSNGSGFQDSSYVEPQMMYPPQPNAYSGYPGHEQMYAQQYNFARQQQFNPRSKTFEPAMRGGAAMPNQSNPNNPYGNAPWYPNNLPLQHQYSNPSQPSAYQPGQPSHFPQPPSNGTRMPAQRTPTQHPRQPQQSSFSSSISKWGVPSTLPPKPPPPAISSPYFEVPKDPLNQQPLPPNPFANGARQAGPGLVGAHAPR